MNSLYLEKKRENEMLNISVTNMSQWESHNQKLQEDIAQMRSKLEHKK